MNIQQWWTRSRRRMLARLAVGTLVIASTAPFAHATKLQDGLLSYWDLDDASGDTAADIAGADFDVGQLRNDPEWLTGADAKLGTSALRFDGIVQDVLLPMSSDMDIGQNAVSVSAWVNFDLMPSDLSEGFGAIFDSNQDSYVLYLDRGNQELRFKVTDDDGTAERPGVPQAMLTTGEWHHVLGVYDGDEGVAKIYYDGQLADKHLNTNLTGLVRAGQLAGIGGNPTMDVDNPSVYFFPGAIDDVAVWDRPLGRAEANYLYANGVGNAVGTANPDLAFIADDQVIVNPVAPTAVPVIHYTFDGDLKNTGSGGAAYDATLLDTPGVNDQLYIPSDSGLALDLRENPVSLATDGDGVSVDYEITDSGTIIFEYTASDFYNYQSLWTNSVNPDDWEMWIYNDGRLRGRVEGDSIVTYDLNASGGAGEKNEIAFTWDRSSDGTGVSVKLYVNGELREADTGAWVDPGTTFFIGSGDGTNHFGNGIWDEFRIYDVALTDGEVLYLFGGGGLAGDFNNDGTLDAGDLDLQAQALGGTDATYDLDNDGDVDYDDRVSWVRDLKKTWVGDADLSGEFNSGDLVIMFAGGKYESGEAATWATGDFNGDGLFTTSDLVAALSDGGYEASVRTAVSAVPEPSSIMLLGIGVLALARRRQ